MYGPPAAGPDKSPGPCCSYSFRWARRWCRTGNHVAIDVANEKAIRTVGKARSANPVTVLLDFDEVAVHIARLVCEPEAPAVVELATDFDAVRNDVFELEFERPLIQRAGVVDDRRLAVLIVPSALSMSVSTSTSPPLTV